MIYCELKILPVQLNQVEACMVTFVYTVCSLAKDCPWAEHLTSLPKSGGLLISSVSAFNQERAAMSCLQRLDANIGHIITSVDKRKNLGTDITTCSHIAEIDAQAFCSH